MNLRFNNFIVFKDKSISKAILNFDNQMSESCFNQIIKVLGKFSFDQGIKLNLLNRRQRNYRN